MSETFNFFDSSDFSFEKKKGESKNLQSSLSPEQWEVVSQKEGPILVVAGAGSGKTRTLVHRVAYLIQEGLSPSSILLLTFTRKAAQEMLRQAVLLVGEMGYQVEGGTFHALANKILRVYGHLLGFTPDFGLMDQDDAESAMGLVRSSYPKLKNDKRFPKKRALLAIHSQAVNRDIDLKEVLANNYIQFLEYATEIETISKEYNEYKKKSNLLDFDDLLLNFKVILEEHQETRLKISSRYQHILVDEYQDTNPIQAQIIHLLAQDHKNITAVGDDAQSIYAFRGASFRNIMEFPKLFPKTKVLKLEENYRSFKPILALANKVMSKAKEKYDKTLVSIRGESEHLPTLGVVFDQKEEAVFICETIKRALKDGLKLNEIAVLFRAGSHSFDLELELIKNEFNFVKYGGQKFLESAHIKDFLAILKILANPADTLSFTRALTLLSGMGPKGASEVAQWVSGKRENLINLREADLKPRVRNSLEPLVQLLSIIAVKGVRLNKRLEETWKFYKPLLKSKYDDWPERRTDINELLRMAESYTDLRSFLADMTLNPPRNSSQQGTENKKSNNDCLTLSTIHSAKGLEWKLVFLLSAVEGRFPASFAVTTPKDLEEERRLLYVAITRAADQLYIMLPTGLVVDRRSGLTARVSRFLADVPVELLRATQNGLPLDVASILDYNTSFSSLRALPPLIRRSFQDSSFKTVKTSNQSPFKASDSLTKQRVNHPVFGLGTVLEQKAGKAIVDFDHFGRKTLVIEFAKLTPA